MSFIIYSKEKTNVGFVLKNTSKTYHLAGRNILYRLWEKRNKPINEGWHVNSNDMLQENDPSMNSDNSALVIDYDPRSLKRIALILLSDIYIFTEGKDGKADWSPMMLKLKEVKYEDEFYVKYGRKITSEEKLEIISEMPWDEPKEVITEFLYLNGDDKAWNWGKNGMTNAVFLRGKAMDYFRKYI